MTKIQVTTGKREEAEKPKPSSFTERLVDAGAPSLPAELIYVVQYTPHFGDSVKVILDIYSKDQKKLLASQETIVTRKTIHVQDFVRLAKRAVDSLTFESKLPRAVRELLVGAE